MNRNKRFLVGKMLKRGARPQVTQEEITLAIQQFKARGGLIKELPPELRRHRPLVGNTLSAAYESVIDH